MLSISILYNFLLITLDTKLFEYSILRALGLNNLGLINLFLIQCLLYAIPAIITGLALSFAGLAFVNIILKQQLNSYISPFPTFKSIIHSSIIGIIVPIISAILPIRNMIKHSIREGLDTNRSKTEGIKIEIKNQNSDFSYGQLFFSLISSIFGIGLYFVTPYAFMSDNIQLIIDFIVFLICGYLLGLILFVMNIQFMLEKIVVNIFLIWSKEYIK